MRFQPKGASRFLLVLFALPETACPLYFPRQPTCHSSLTTGSGNLLPLSPTPAWGRVFSSPFPQCPALPSTAALTTDTGSVCPSVHFSHGATSSVRKGTGHTCPSTGMELVAPFCISLWADEACTLGLIFPYFLTLTLGLHGVLFLITDGEKRLHKPFVSVSGPLEAAERGPSLPQSKCQHTSNTQSTK